MSDTLFKMDNFGTCSNSSLSKSALWLLSLIQKQGGTLDRQRKRSILTRDCLKRLRMKGNQCNGSMNLKSQFQKVTDSE